MRTPGAQDMRTGRPVSDRARCGLALAMALVAVAALPGTAAAASFTWRGAAPATSPSWSTAANWTTSAPSGAVGTLTFPALTDPICSSDTPTNACSASDNDLTGLSADALSIDLSAMYTITGQAITLGGGGITASAPVTGTGVGSTLRVPLTLSAPQTWSAVGNQLAVDADVTGGANALRLTAGPDGQFYLQGAVEAGTTTITGRVFLAGDGGGQHPGSINATNGHAVVVQGSGSDRALYLTATGGGDSGSGPITATAANLYLGDQGGLAGRLKVSGAVSLDAASTLVMAFGSAGTVPGTNYPQVDATGPVDLGGSTLFPYGDEALPDNASNCETMHVGDVLPIVRTTGALTGTFADTPAGTTRTIDCVGGAGTAPTVRIDYTAHTVTATVLTAGSAGTTTPPPPTARRATQTAVSCDAERPDDPTRDFLCTATVGDASGTEPQGTPTGTVSFAIDAGRGGAFRSGSTCSLQRSSSGPTAFCSVTYLPGSEPVPAGTQPPLGASYGGDTTFATSTGRPTNRDAAPPDDTPPPTPPTVPDPLVGPDVPAVPDTLVSSIDGCAPATTPNDTTPTPTPPAGATARATNPILPPTVDDPFCPYRARYTAAEKEAAGRWADYWSARSAASAKAAGSVGVIALGAGQIPEPIFSKGAAVFFGVTSAVIGIRSADFSAMATQESAVNHDPPDPDWQVIAAAPRVWPGRLGTPPGLSRRGRAAVRAYALAVLHETADQLCMTDTINRATTALGNHDVATSHRQYVAGQACATDAAAQAARLPGLARRAQPALAAAMPRLSRAQGRRLVAAARRLERTAAGRRAAAARVVASLQRVIALPPAVAAQLRTSLAVKVAVPQSPRVVLDTGHATQGGLLDRQTAQVFAAAAATSAG